MEQFIKLAALIGPSIAALGFFADNKHRTRAAIKDTLELADKFSHEPDIARRLRARASSIASEYLDEVERAPYPLRVRFAAWVLALVAMVVVGLTGLMPPHPTTYQSLAYGFGIAVAAYAFRRPVAVAVAFIARHQPSNARPPADS